MSIWSIPVKQHPAIRDPGWHFGVDLFPSMSFSRVQCNERPRYCVCEIVSGKLRNAELPAADLVVGIGSGGIVLVATTAHELRVPIAPVIELPGLQQ